MSNQTYLSDLLKSQILGDDSDEMKALRQHRAEVETLLRDEFGAFSPTIKYGGSKAKGTLIRQSYDLDLVCYFPSGENGAGDSLEEIFKNVGKVLEGSYHVVPKTSSVRLKSHDALWSDFHIDVVPGRFTDDGKGDCYLYQNGAEKCRLKTNLKTHIELIRDAGVTPALRLLKLWRSRRAIGIKNFVWELVCIKLLEDMKTASLSEQMEHVLRSVAESENAISVQDPANPSGNDLMPFLNDNWFLLRGAAAATVTQFELAGWEGVFGRVESVPAAPAVQRLTGAAASSGSSTQPWLP